MLLELKDFLKNKKKVSIQELTLHFSQELPMMRCLLAHWIKKGKVFQIAKPPGCGLRCQLCPSQLTEIYQWIENHETEKRR